VDGSSRYRLLVLPGTELNEIFVSLYEASPEGKKRKAIVEDQSTGAGYYPSRVALPVELPPIRKGFYYVEISATSQQKASVSCSMFFFYPGR
jgi:hypothetical protein